MIAKLVAINDTNCKPEQILSRYYDEQHSSYSKTHLQNNFNTLRI